MVERLILPKQKHGLMNVLNLPDHVQSLPNSLHNVVSVLQCVFHMLWHLSNDIRIFRGQQVDLIGVVRPLLCSMFEESVGILVDKV